MKRSGLEQSNSCTDDGEAVLFSNRDFFRGTPQPSGRWEVVESCMQYTDFVSNFGKHLGLLLEKRPEKGCVSTGVPRRNEQNVMFGQRNHPCSAQRQVVITFVDEDCFPKLIIDMLI